MDESTPEATGPDAARARRAQRNREAAHRSRDRFKQRRLDAETRAKIFLALYSQLRSVLDELTMDMDVAAAKSEVAVDDIDRGKEL